MQKGTQRQIISLVIFLVALLGVHYLAPLVESKLSGVSIAQETLSVSSGSYILYTTSQLSSSDPVSTKISLYRFPVGGTKATLIASQDRPGYANSNPSFSAVGQTVSASRWFWENAQDAMITLDGQITQQQGGSPNGETTIASADGKWLVKWTKTYVDRVASVSMQLYPNAPKVDAPLVDTVLDPTSLGITLGYAEPFLVSDDGKTVYLRQVFDGETCLQMGLWMFDVATAKTTPVAAIVKDKIQEYHIDPATNMLIGSTYALGLAEGPTCGIPIGPSTMHLVDLRTGLDQQIARDPKVAFLNPFLSPDNTSVAYNVEPGGDPDGGTRVLVIGPAAAVVDVPGTSGRISAWVDQDDLVVVRDTGEILLYHPSTDTTTSIVSTVENPAWSPAIEYTGTVTIK